MPEETTVRSLRARAEGSFERGPGGGPIGVTSLMSGTKLDVLGGAWLKPGAVQGGGGIGAGGAACLSPVSGN